MKIKRFFALIMTISIIFPLYISAAATALTTDSNIELAQIAINNEYVARQAISSQDGISEIDHNAIDIILHDSRHVQNSVISRDISYSYSVLDLAAVFSLADGLTITEIGSIHSNALIAFADASNMGDFTDSYKHFTWNNRCCSTIGSNAAKIGTNNYEWGNTLIDEYNEYFLERYNYYLQEYDTYIYLGALTFNDIEQYARADADDYIVRLRNLNIDSCANRESYFYYWFSDSNLMDFWNNYYGRYYSMQQPDYTPSEAFDASYNAGVIVLYPSALSQSRKDTIYYGNFWR